MARQVIKSSTLTIVLAALLTFAGASMAEDRDDWKKGSSDAQWDDFRMVQTERHEMIVGLMKITKGLVDIVNNLNHHPSDADKAQLQEMSNKLDALIAKDDEMSRKMAGKWNQKWKDKQ